MGGDIVGFVEVVLTAKWCPMPDWVPSSEVIGAERGPILRSSKERRLDRSHMVDDERRQRPVCVDSGLAGYG